jgi:hypothetical protein
MIKTFRVYRTDDESTPFVSAKEMKRLVKLSSQ